MTLTRAQWRDLILVAGLAGLVAAAALGAGRFDLVSGNRAGIVYDRTYTPQEPLRASVERIEGDWTLAGEGLTLDPGGTGVLTIRLQNPHEGRLVAMLFGRSGDGFHFTLAVSPDGTKPFRPVAGDVSLDGGRVDLTPVAGIHETVAMRVQASTKARGAAGVISRIRVLVVKPPPVLPNVPIASVLVLAPVLAFLLRTRSRGAGALVYGLAVLAMLALMTEARAWDLAATDPARWWEAVMASQDRDFDLLGPYALLLLLFWWTGRPGPAAGDAPEPDNTWAWFAMGGVLAFGGSRRLGALAEMAWSPLDPDVITYVKLAERMQGPYDTGSREPLWLWIVKAWLGLAGNTTLSVRVLTVLLSLVLLTVAYKVFRDYTGRPLVGVLVAGFLAVNPYLISLSVRGLRDEAYLIAVLTVVSFTLVRDPARSPRAQVLGLAVSGAAALLLRLNSYIFILPLLLYWVWRQGAAKWKQAALALALMTVVTAPHLVHNARTFGDPLYSMNVHFVWMRNVEFVAIKKTTCAGCPTPEELQVNATQGPSLSAFDYLFGYHSVPEVIATTLRGYRDTYLRPTPLFQIQSGTQSRLGFAIYLFGVFLVLLGPYWEMLALMALLANAVPFALAIGVDPRLAIQTAPFVTFCLACGLWGAADLARRLWHAVGELSGASPWHYGATGRVAGTPADIKRPVGLRPRGSGGG
jgi:hypothetical protein